MTNCMKGIALLLVIILILPISHSLATSEIPHWIKNNAKWWSEGMITDADFLQGVEWLLKNEIIKIDEIPNTEMNENKVPSWIKDTANFWSNDQISDTEFLNALKFLIKKGIIKIETETTPTDTIQMINRREGSIELHNTTSLFKTFVIENDFTIVDGRKTWNSIYFELNPQFSDLYNEISINQDEQRSLVIYPIFTASAYTEPGFYTYYRGECDTSCLTIKIIETAPVQASPTGLQVLSLLGYEITTDLHVDLNPELLKQYDKVVLLHNEYVTKREFEAIINHPKVIYLYPNALYAEVEVNYEDLSITLIRGHNYPDSNIRNGFDWKWDNSPFEYDTECQDVKFQKIDNGWMLNCWPADIIHENATLLKQIKDF